MPLSIGMVSKYSLVDFKYMTPVVALKEDLQLQYCTYKMEAATVLYCTVIHEKNLLYILSLTEL